MCTIFMFDFKQRPYKIMLHLKLNMFFYLNKNNYSELQQKSAVHYVLHPHETVFLIQLDAFIQTANDFKSKRELLVSP